jgi:excisionase family DNA binding protein
MGNALHMTTEYLSTGEAARILGVSRVAVTLMVQQGKLPAIRVGRSWAVPRDELPEFAKAYRKGAGGRRGKVRERESRCREQQRTSGYPQNARLVRTK